MLINILYSVSVISIRSSLFGPDVSWGTMPPPFPVYAVSAHHKHLAKMTARPVAASALYPKTYPYLAICFRAFYRHFMFQ